MQRYTKESLEILRQKIDIVEVISGHIQLKKQGSSHKALCPFHDEKSPSFTINAGQAHYHCFGCGAHGDAIQFLMQHLRMTFHDAVVYLADRFQVVLQEATTKEDLTGVKPQRIKEVLAYAERFFQYVLLYTEEGKEALNYLIHRGINPSFIHTFHIGYAPKNEKLLISFLVALRYTIEEMIEAGVVSERNHRPRPFFVERITFPIHDVTGSCIGFSARKIRDDVFGGKYINTSETHLFKKSRILFGLNYSRRRIAKEKQVLLVEGQLDALRLIFSGFDYAVSSLGTAFGQAHVKELERLGATKVYLLFDQDKAGIEAAIKAGHQLQKKGIEVFVAELPSGTDPDLVLVNDGPVRISRVLLEAKEYLTYLVDSLRKKYNMQSPAEKQIVVNELKARLADWESPVMVHESSKKVAAMLNLPEELVRLDAKQQSVSVKVKAAASLKTVDPSRILEADLLRWLILTADANPQLVEICRSNLSIEELKEPISKKLLQEFFEAFDLGKQFDLIECSLKIDDEDFEDFIEMILNKKIQREKARIHFIETLQRIKERNWMQEREDIKVKIHSGTASDVEVLALVRAFDSLRKNPPKLTLPVGVK